MTAEKLSAKDQPPVVVEKVRNWYRTVVGSFNFLAAWTRPEISHACSELSKFMSNPGLPHVEAVKRLGRYVEGTLALVSLIETYPILTTRPISCGAMSMLTGLAILIIVVLLRAMCSCSTAVLFRGGPNASILLRCLLLRPSLSLLPPWFKK